MVPRAGRHRARAPRRGRSDAFRAMRCRSGSNIGAICAPCSAASNEFFFSGAGPPSNGRRRRSSKEDRRACIRDCANPNLALLFWRSRLVREAAGPLLARYAHAADAASNARARQHHGRQDGLAGPHQPPAQHADQQLPQPARDALTQPETLGWRSGHAARLTVIATGAADGLGRRPIVGDAAAEPAAH